ncbi:E3 ubiquitin-protein ligase RFWD3-like [Centruroides sculpturatus]|uniref:E3 ubiquitin-protein ligase RFWD3-like n=1 Tax=Centruroides sculpturatus TaxID=218467 RepID=UPI000C6DD9DE|nr:E3 ubiquitin-protein ligase RFWD3-like [Centruroides sculpturatus]
MLLNQILSPAENEISTPDPKNERLSDIDEPIHVEEESEEISQVLTEDVNYISEINEEQVEIEVSRGLCANVVLGQESKCPQRNAPAKRADCRTIFAKRMKVLDTPESFLEFVSIYRKPIKDIAFHRSDTLVLTASMDRSIKLTNILSNSNIQSYTLPFEAWSCVWSKDDPTEFFCCCLYEMKKELDYKLHPLSLEGSFISIRYGPGTDHVLVSKCLSGKHASYAVWITIDANRSD